MYTIGFDLHALDGRGTTTTAFDYACYCQSVLNYNVKLFYDSSSEHQPSLELFKSRFEIFPYAPNEDFRRVTQDHKLDVAYAAKAGWDDGRRATAGRNVVHVVFKRYHPHADVYASVSKWLSDTLTGGRMPFVPHIVRPHIPSRGMRARFGIPNDAFVIGRHGGYNEFNIEFAHQTILTALKKRKNLWFLFFNTKPFCQHERVIFNDFFSANERDAYLDTVDVGLNARLMGESFGLAIAEFLSAGKPVFAWEGGMDRNHTVMIPKQEWLYRRSHDLLDLLVNYEPSTKDEDTARAAVEEFAPEPVIRKFEEVFIKGPAGIFQKVPLTHKFLTQAKHDIDKLRFKLWLRS